MPTLLAYYDDSNGSPVQFQIVVLADVAHLAFEEGKSTAAPATLIKTAANEGTV